MTPPDGRQESVSAACSWGSPSRGRGASVRDGRPHHQSLHAQRSAGCDGAGSRTILVAFEKTSCEQGQSQTPTCDLPASTQAIGTLCRSDRGWEAATSHTVCVEGLGLRDAACSSGPPGPHAPACVARDGLHSPPRPAPPLQPFLGVSALLIRA